MLITRITPLGRGNLDTERVGTECVMNALGTLYYYGFTAAVPPSAVFQG